MPPRSRQGDHIPARHSGPRFAFGVCMSADAGQGMEVVTDGRCTEARSVALASGPAITASQGALLDSRLRGNDGLGPSLCN